MKYRISNYRSVNTTGSSSTVAINLSRYDSGHFCGEKSLGKPRSYRLINKHTMNWISTIASLLPTQFWGP